MDRHLKNGLSALIFVFFLCLASSAFAGGYAPAVPYFDGFYAGLGGGVVSAMADTKTTAAGAVVSPGPEPANSSSVAIDHDLDLGKHGVNGNVFIGFGKTLGSAYYLGGELFGNLFSPKMKGSFSASTTIVTANMQASTKVKSPYSFGGDIRGGYLVFPKVMLYVLFGLDYAKFKVNSDISTDLLVRTPIMLDNDFSKWRLGYMPGVGIELGLCNHLSLRGQYTYTFYPSFSRSVSGSFSAAADVDATAKTKVDPSRGLFTLKLSYLF
jgi:opacity protein-like surface antigen